MLKRFLYWNQKKRQNFLPYVATLLFCLIALTLYLHASHKKENIAKALYLKKKILDEKKQSALVWHKHLLECLDSQGDFEWLELVLKEKLEVVPEGEVKVIFKPSI